MFRNIKLCGLYGFTLAETLIVLMIIVLVAMISVPSLKKTKKIKEKIPHGTYACTIFDGEEYYFKSDVTDDNIPNDKHKWKKGKCSTDFEMPVKAGLLEVKVIGAGGSGGEARAQWDDSIIPKTFYDTSLYEIPKTGWYDIYVSGTKGSSSYIAPWTAAIDGTEHTCFAQAAQAGEKTVFKGSIYLYKKDSINIVYEKSSINSLNLSCSSLIPIPQAQAGQNGQDIIISRNGSRILAVEGSKAGNYICNASNLCGKHYEAVKGENGKIITYTTFKNKSEESSSASYESGVTAINWSDLNHTTRLFKPKSGCGGTSGEIRSFLYPMLKNKLPDIEIGRPGSSDTEPSATTFGSLTANPGVNNKICTQAEDDLNGVDGKTFMAVKELFTQGGRGGISVNSDDINGKNAVGFASGGGGGAIYYSSVPVYDSTKTLEENENPYLNGKQRWYQGKGGKGAPGLVVLTW